MLVVDFFKNLYVIVIINISLSTVELLNFLVQIPYPDVDVCSRSAE